jgi:hypothetical protein
VLCKNDIWLLIYMYECMVTLLNGRHVFLAIYAGPRFAERLGSVSLVPWFLYFLFLFFFSARHV